jgi:hypothetical protein
MTSSLEHKQQIGGEQQQLHGGCITSVRPLAKVRARGG